MTILLSKQRYEQELRSAPHGTFLSNFHEKIGRAPTSADYKLLQKRYMTEPGQALAQRHYSLTQLRFGKHVRPWFFVDPSSVLPADQVWVGFEVETGYTNRAALTQAIGKLARCKQLVALDVEGSGSYPLEVTFFPVALGDMEVKSGPLRIINMVRGNPPAGHDPMVSMVGTHFNFSTPGMRQRHNPTFSTSAVGQAIARLGDARRELLFGRRNVYGPVPYWHGTHVECKWFNTTYDKKVWARYCRVIRAFVAEVQALGADGARQQDWDRFFTELASQEEAREIRAATRRYRRAS